ncbi:MAG: helix-turn-helix transcriptional regulator [Egibacteraceae bacterium]
MSKRKSLDQLKAQARAEDPAAFDAAYERAGRDIELGDRVRQLRLRAGLSQAELARRIGTTQPAIARLEAGGTSPSIHTLDRVARALGARLEILFVEPLAASDS